jgi:hypothetical protein
LPKEVVNDFSCRAIPAHQGVDLGIKRATPGLTKPNRRKNGNGIASLEDPDYCDVSSARSCWFDRPKGGTRLDSYLKSEALIFIRSHHEPFRYYFS